MLEPELANHCGHDRILTFVSTNLLARRFDIYDLPASLSRCLLATMWLSVEDLPATKPFPMPVPELDNHCGHDRH